LLLRDKSHADNICKSGNTTDVLLHILWKLEVFHWVPM